MEYTQSEVLQYIAENDVKFIKLLFTDIFGVTKSISVMPEELPRAFKTGISFDASAVKGFLQTSESDLLLVPDSSTLAVLPWRPQHGRVVRFYCNVKKPDGSPFDGDARLLLQKTAEKAKQMDYECRIGTECEFYLFNLDENGNPTSIPHDNASYCDFAPLDKGENVRREICLTLEEMGIKPETSHHESGPGQHEIDFKYSALLQAADNLATFKTVVRTVAAKNGLSANFDPKPIADKSGSGLHINLSLLKGGRNLFDNERLPADASSFIAGILSHIKEISLFLNPLESSYKRLGRCEAPKYVSWSRQNRSQLIRIPAATGDLARIELRSPDPECNQYFALSLIIHAGLEGIKNNLKLPKAVNENLYTAPDSITEKLEKLPQSLSESIEITKNSGFVRSILPEATLDAFISAKTKEIASINN